MSVSIAPRPRAVRAEIDGREFDLRKERGRRWEGFLRPAGIADGNRPEAMDVRLRLRYGGGEVERTLLDLPLRAGYG